ncbi:MAG: hypothetical protein JST16_04980 [Bdellovibrionales bacterium]|nr:hypothetical protein [Bdellovibrionales bacterium]
MTSPKLVLNGGREIGSNRWLWSASRDGRYHILVTPVLRLYPFTLPKYG